MNKNARKLRRDHTNVFVHLFFIFWGLICLIPFIMLISASFSSDKNLAIYGYRILPIEIDLSAYKLIFDAPATIFNAYKITIITTFATTFLTMVVISLCAYALARKSHTTFGVAITYYLYFPSLFSGGLVASYILNTRYLHLTDSLWVLILPGLVSAYNIFMIRTFIKQQPISLFEAAKLDGASELLIYFKIGLPLAKPVLATVAFNTALGNWNAWYNSMIYMRTPSKITLQHLLQKMMMQVTDILRAIEQGVQGIDISQMPTESTRMAMLVIAIGPMMFLFPFFQKYFVKGMVLGAVKG